MKLCFNSCANLHRCSSLSELYTTFSNEIVNITNCHNAKLFILPEQQIFEFGGPFPPEFDQCSLLSETLKIKLVRLYPTSVNHAFYNSRDQEINLLELIDIETCYPIIVMPIVEQKSGLVLGAFEFDYPFYEYGKYQSTKTTYS